MAQKVILAGNAITAQILHAYLASDFRYAVAGATVDDQFVSGGLVTDLQTVPLSRVAAVFPPSEFRVIMAIGYNNLNKVRESVFARLKELGYQIETYVHLGARVHTDIPLGEGCVVLPGAAIEPFAALGPNTMVWCNVTLAHHCLVGEHCWIASGAVISGQAKVLRNTFVGVNATVVNRVVAGAYSIIGAGALISKDTKPNSVHLARSAEPLRYSSDDYVKHFGF